MDADALKSRLDAACVISQEAGAIIRQRAGDRSGVAFKMKGHQDYLTAVDGEVEEFVRGRLSAQFPDDALIGEEGGGEAADLAWVIDPIDGTANFARGIAHYCISIAFVAEGRAQIGVIYDPERDELFAAATGMGATLNGRSMRVSEATDLRQTAVECGWSMRLPITDWVALVDRVSATGAGIYRSGSGALGVAYVAAGRIDGYCELHINAWDVLAGIVLVQEAGGLVNEFLAGDGLRKGNPILACGPGIAAELSRATGIALP